VGTRVAGTGMPPAVRPGQLRQVLARPEPASYFAPGRLIAIAPIVEGAGRRTLGAIVLARPSDALGHRLAALWTWLAAVSAAGLLAAALVAAGLARWVNRPLAALEAATHRLGDGALDTRAAAAEGPREVRRLAVNFNAMAARLQALVHGHRAMMADVSHQLRTPLAALRLRLDVLAQEGSGGTADDVAAAQDEIARLTRMVNGLLAVARAESITAQPVRVEVAVVIGERVTAWRPAAEERRVTLLAPHVDPVSARAGEGHLEQIMDNLLANALDAVPAGGTVRVSVSAAGTMARIVVADDGPGMSEQQRQVAFRRFASTTAGGTGLGLAIVDRLTASNGGSATLSGTPGGGLTVTIELPAQPRDRSQRRPDPTAS
jgi:signal transduction histidine kinase